MLIAQSQATDAGALRYGAPAELRGWSRTRHWMSNPLQAAGYAFRWLIPASVKALDQQSPLSKRCGFLLVASLCAGTVVLVLSQGHAWYHACRNIQSNWYVKKSQESLVQGSLTHAVEWANRAYFASQHNPASIRNMATLATRLRKDEARYLWENLRLEGVMTTDDKVLEIEAHLNCREDKAALMKLESLLRETAPTARMVSLADVLMGRLGKKQELLSLLASYAALHPADPDAKLLLATRKLMFDAGPESPDDVNAVWRLATHNTGTAGLQALEFLDHNSKFDAEDARTLIELLERHPLATAKHRVAALRWRTILQPERKRDLIQEALQKEDDPVPLAQWLNATGEHAAIVEHFGKSLKFDNHPLVEIFLDSLAQLEQEEDYIDVVNDPRARFARSERECSLAHLCQVTGKSSDRVNEHLMNAEAAALEEGRFDRILGIAHYAEMHDQPLAAEKAYRLASAVPSLELEGFEGLLRMAMRQGNSGAYLDLTRETTVKWTSNEHYAELHLYACLLVGEDLETNAKRAEALLESRPGDSMRKLLAAIARYREGNPSAAVRCLDHISMEELTSGQVAVIGGIYSAAGQPHIASDISRRVGTVELLPEEERLLKQARRAQ